MLGLIVYTIKLEHWVGNIFNRMQGRSIRLQDSRSLGDHPDACRIIDTHAHPQPPLRYRVQTPNPSIAEAKSDPRPRDRQRGGDGLNRMMMQHAKGENDLWSVCASAETQSSVRAGDNDLWLLGTTYRSGQVRPEHKSASSGQDPRNSVAILI